MLGRLVLVAPLLLTVSGFVAPRPLPRLARRATVVAATPLDVVKPALESYAEIWTPFFAAASEAGLAPEWLLHWGHPAAMASVLLTMGLYGSFLGFAVRNGDGSAVYPLSLGETARDLHPKVMAGALFFFFLGGQGGLVLAKVFDAPLLESPHAATAFLSLGLLVLQAALPLLFPRGQVYRTAHAALGTVTMVALFVHAALGLQLGLSF